MCCPGLNTEQPPHKGGMQSSGPALYCTRASCSDVHFSQHVHSLTLRVYNKFSGKCTHDLVGELDNEQRGGRERLVSTLALEARAQLLHIVLRGAQAPSTICTKK